MLTIISFFYMKCTTKFSLFIYLFFFLMKMQHYCEKIVINESFKVLPIVSYSLFPIFQAELEYRDSRSARLLRLSTNQIIL